MPELPEVETVVRDLRPQLLGRGFTAVRSGPRKLRKPWDAAWEKLLIGTQVEAVRRRGKWIVIDLATGSSLVVHLGMTGQFTIVDANEPEADHVHLVFTLDRGERELRFRDIRRFGSATLYPDSESLRSFFDQSELGPEPFDVPRDYWRERLQATKRNLKATLLDQRLVVGVGNIYADESLFEAKLHPARIASNLSPKDADRLRRAVEVVLTRAIEARGSSIRNYVGGSGLRGGYQDRFRVYGRTGEPCRRCKTAIVCARLAGRSSHYCPKCQKE